MIRNVCQDPALWNTLISENGGTIFHTYEWGRLMEQLDNVRFYPILYELGHTTMLSPFFTQNDKLSGSMIGYGGPILIGEHQISLSEYEKIAVQIFHKPIHRLLLSPYASAFSSYEADLWNQRDTYIRELPDTYDELLASCSGKARTSVRYAMKQGVEIQKLGLEDIDLFYRLYIDHQVSVGANYTLGKHFFTKLIHDLEGKVLFLGAFLDRQLVGVSVFLYDADTLCYWMNIGTPAGRKVQCSYLLMNHALRYAIDNRIRAVDFGYSHSAEVARPKRYWGARPQPCFQLKERM